jgi:bifunctional DNA-binding transcriptional regulator/antitoxin component of YhaV-PrlF toxin-antitoxin module
MLAKMTSKNQITLPKSLVEEMGAPEYFDIRAENGQLVLAPVRIQRADSVRAKLAELGIGEQDVTAAMQWARAKR